MTMPEAASSPRRALVVLNPVGGHSAPDEVRRILAETFEPAGIAFSIYETTPDDAATAGAIRNGIQDGSDLIVAAGGDGTVSLVADAVTGSGARLGILPVGTANVLALELGVPQDVRQAAELLISESVERELDMMKIGERGFILQVGIGLDSLMINDTDRAAKRRFGRLAYMATLVSKAVGYQSRRFTLLVDGKRMRLRAYQLMVANAGTLGIPPFKWGPEITPSDGELDLCIVTVRRPIDYLRLLRQVVSGTYQSGSNIRYIRVQKQVIISADSPLPVQADGEIIGDTPVQIGVVPRGIRVVVPPAGSQPSIISIARKVDAKQEEPVDK